MAGNYEINSYLLDNKLIAKDHNEDLVLIPSAWFIAEGADKVFSGDERETKIVLCALITVFMERRPEELKKLQFSLTLPGDMWSIWLSWKDGSRYNGLDWTLIVHTVQVLVDKMPPSNESYLADTLIYDF